MYRFLTLIFLTLTSCLSCLPAKMPKVQVSDIDEMAEKTVALVQFVDDEGNEVDPDKGTEMAYCAGVWVSEDKILTAHHCIDDTGLGGRVYVQQRGRKGVVAGEVVKDDKEDDLALVQCKLGYHPVAKVALKNPEPGQDLHIVGHPAHRDWTYMHGYVSGYRDDVGHRPHVMQVQAPIFYGNSGGPAFDNEGLVVGITSMLSTGVPNLGWFIPAHELQAFLGA